MGATGWYWYPGTIDAATLVGTPTNDLGLFPVQGDMISGIEWMRPDNAADNPDDAEEIVTGSNGFTDGYGDPTIPWKLLGLRPLMVAFIKATMFPGGVWTYPATIGMPISRSTGTARYFQALASRTQFSSAELALGGLNNWLINFVNAHEIAPPP